MDVILTVIGLALASVAVIALFWRGLRFLHELIEYDERDAFDIGNQYEIRKG